MSNEKAKAFARKVHEYVDGIASEHAMVCVAQPHEHAKEYDVLRLNERLDSL
jgi:hypothetical protein